MIISHYNVIVLCRQLAPGLCVRCVAAYSWDDQQYDPCGTCTGRMSMPRPPPHHFYDYTLLAVLAFLVFLYRASVRFCICIRLYPFIARFAPKDDDGIERTIIASATIRRSRSNWMKRCPTNHENCNRTLIHVDVKSLTITLSVILVRRTIRRMTARNSSTVPRKLLVAASRRKTVAVMRAWLFFQISFGDLPGVRYLILALSGC